MMKRLIFLVLLMPCAAFPQKKLYLTLQYGISNYHGDLQEKVFTLEQGNKAIGAGLALRITPQFYLHGTLFKGKISADDAFSKKPEHKLRNLNFVSHIYEAALSAEYSVFDLSYRSWTPYGFAGLALFRFNPFSSAGELRNLNTEGQGIVSGRKPYRILTFSVPYGAGIRVRISNNVHVGYEVGFRMSLTDYLDDVSKTYVDEELLRRRRGERAVRAAFRGNLVDRNASYPIGGTPRGSSGTFDSYYFSTIRIAVGITNDDGKLFGKTVRRGSLICPRW